MYSACSGQCQTAGYARWSIFSRRFGLPDEHIVIEGGGRAPGLPEMERFCADLLYDFADR
ncbi:MAG TPA: hypothetical protein VIA06_04845 [Candidatus Dormibacteraeota bacterium]|jgi:hypothetical protein|nr:hypothetical protein [Candidatus Dormibacteraeota bacterium]